jgi:lipid A 3-O-deacylase PagL
MALLFSAGNAFAQTRPAWEPANFPKGTMSLTTYGAFTRNFTGPRAIMGSGTVGVGYYVFDNVSLNAEFSRFHTDQAGPDADIYALNALLRQHLYHRGRFSLFVDVGGAVSISDTRTPPNGTYYNYMEETGVGSTIQIKDDLHLIGGLRYYHLSNARLEGPVHNPSINGLQGYIGLMLRF